MTAVCVCASMTWLHYSVLFCSVLFCSVLFCSVLFCSIVCYVLCIPPYMMCGCVNFSVVCVEGSRRNETKIKQLISHFLCSGV